MNVEWIFQGLLVVVSAFLGSFLGYFLAKRSQKTQALREYIMEIVKDDYPALFREMKFNSETLDNYLEEPNVSFNFSELRGIYDRGLDEFMKKHHKDLHLMVDSFHKDILPEFDELSVGELMKRLFDVSERLLKESLPKEAVDKSDRIATDIAQTMGAYRIIPDLLNDRDVEVRRKIEGCILERISEIPQDRINAALGIEKEIEEIDYEGISQKILEKAKSEAKYLVDKFKKLKREYDSEVKDKLLPLLQKYISNPV